MKRLLLVFVILCCAVILHAQQLPQYSQYNFNELLINPAVTGIESYWDVKSGYRNQWTGLQGAPKTLYLTLSIPLNTDFTLNDYGQMLGNVDNPNGKAAANDYLSSVEHSGIGLSIVSDKTAQISQTHVDFSYAYHLQTSNRFNVSVGASLGFNNIALNVAQITLSNPSDPALSTANASQYKPEAAVGVWGYGANFFVGASVQQLLPGSISFGTTTSSTSASSTYAQYFLTTGIRAYLTEDVTLLPSVVVRPFQKGPSTYDVNMKFAFRDSFWVGGAYRKDDAYAASFGFNLGAFLTLGYSYDYNTSALNTVSYGTHEIMLGVFLKNNYNTTSPRHTW